MRKKKLENSKHSINNKNQRKMGKLVEGIKVAAKVAEIVMASAIVIELVGKWRGKSKAASVETVADETAETEQASYEL